MSNSNVINSRAIPFLRWAGGKKWLIKDIVQFLPELGFNNYHEPFLGGGAIYFNLQPKGKCFLNDTNIDLINTYRSIYLEVEDVINELKKFENTEICYYNLRSKKFKLSAKKAAQFIYLNQTSFNGIYRVNLKGEYNVPYGFRNKNFLDESNLRAVSEVLGNAEFTCQDFSKCIDNVQPNDLVFLDPPYTITHNDNGFFKYNKKLFSEMDQHRLSHFIDQIRERGAYYILTNAAHEKVREIFDKEERIVEMKRASLVGGINAKRDKYSEFIFTNCNL